MLSENFKLFLKSSIFSYSSKVFLLIISFFYTYLIANALGPGSYGLAMYLLAFFGNLVYLFGTEVFTEVLVVFTPKKRSRKLFFTLTKLLVFLFIILFFLFFLFSSEISAFLGRGPPGLLRLCSFIFLLMPFSLLFIALFKGFKQFGKVLKVLVAEGFSNLLFAFLFVSFFGLGIFGVVYAKFISLGVALVLSIFYFRLLPFEKKQINFKEVRKYAKGMFMVNFFKKLRTQAVLIYMGLFILNRNLGFYYVIEKLANSFIGMPIASLSEVVLPFTSEKTRSKKALSRYVSYNIKLTIMIAIMSGFFLVAAGYFILSTFFPDYLSAYYLISFFVLLYIGLSVSPIAIGYKCINKVEYITKASSMNAMVQIFLGFFLIFNFHIIGIILTQVIGNLVAFIYLYLKQKEVGLKIEVRPRKKDLLFFYNSIKLILKQTL